VKKLAALLLVLAVCLFALQGCAQNTAAGGTSGTASQNDESSFEKPSEKAESLRVDPDNIKSNFYLTAELPNQVIYEGDGLVVKTLSMESRKTATDETVLGATESKIASYVALNVEIDNDCGRRITAKAYDISVNGFMTNDYSSSEWVDSGEHERDYFVLGTLNLFNLAGIEDIGSIEFTLEISDSDTWDVISAEHVSLTTDIDDGNVQNIGGMADKEGSTLFDEDGIRIVGLGMDRDGLYSPIGPGMMLYVENNTDQPIFLEAGNNATINGKDYSAEEYESWSYLSINRLTPGKRAYTSFSVLGTRLDDIGLRSMLGISDLKCAFIIRNADTQDTIAETPMLAFGS